MGAGGGLPASGAPGPGRGGGGLARAPAATTTIAAAFIDGGGRRAGPAADAAVPAAATGVDEALAGASPVAAPAASARGGGGGRPGGGGRFGSITRAAAAQNRRTEHTRVAPRPRDRAIAETRSRDLGIRKYIVCPPEFLFTTEPTRLWSPSRALEVSMCGFIAAPRTSVPCMSTVSVPRSVSFG